MTKKKKKEQIKTFKLLELLEQYEKTLDGDLLFPQLQICSDGSGDLISGNGDTIAEFNNEVELIAILTN